MSFGIAISDFIAIADKAYLVYRRCKDAPGKYTGLTNRVLRLRDVLEDTKAYLVEANDKQQIPKHHLRLASLQAMCDGCNSTLDEVDNFLSKYKNFGTETGTQRMISRLRFIRSDADVLIKQLDLDASSLQLRLSSLTGLSLILVQNAVERITHEYRTGVRQPSVISHPKLDNNPVERQEMFEQISQDLEDKDIHPDSISLNKGFLDEWLAKVVEDGGLDERDPVPPSSIDDRRPATTDETAINAQEDSADIKQQATQSDDAQAIELQATSRDILQAGDVQHAGPNDDLYADPDSMTTRPEDSITVIEENFMREGLAGVRSRSNSTTSSTGKPEDWHPYDRPAPGYVKEKLYPLFHDDPTPEPVSEKTKHMIMRAFHQADYSDEGYLTRRTVMQHLSAALSESSLQLDSTTLEGIVLSFDANRDGQFDIDEFLNLAQELMRRTSQARANQTKAKFAAIVQEAKVKARTRREKDSRFFIHWGFSRKPGSTEEYVDDVLQETINTPPKVLEDSSFSVMAWEANICVDKISDFEEKWIGIVPKLLQSQYLDPLRKVQKLARAFILLENQRDRFVLSDLDVLVTCIHLIVLGNQQRDIEGAKRVQLMLEAAKLKCGLILDGLLGFTETLDRMDTFDTSVHNFGNFQKWWKMHQIVWRCEVVSNESTEWISVKDAISASRTPKLLPGLQTLARIVVADFPNRRQKFVETPWNARLGAAFLKISGSIPFDHRKVLLRITISHPHQVIQTWPVKRTKTCSWDYSSREPVQVQLQASSEICVEEIYQDNKGSRVKFRYPAQSMKHLRFSQRTVAQPYGSNAICWDHPNPIRLTFLLQYSPEFDAELNALTVRGWRFELPQEDPVPSVEPGAYAYFDPGQHPSYYDAHFPYF